MPKNKMKGEVEQVAKAEALGREPVLCSPVTA
jgi:hypothetical protein